VTSSEPKYRVEIAERFTIVTLEPAFSTAQWGEIESVGTELLKQLNGQKAPVLLVDLSALSYIGSSMVALVVRLWKAIKKNDGRIAVINQHPVVLEVLQIAGLHKVWPIVKTRDEALAELGVRAPGKGGKLGMMVACLGLTAAVAAIAGLVIQMSPGLAAKLAVKSEVVQSLQFGGAGLGLLLGLINVVRETGGRRFLAVVTLLACLTAGVIGVLIQVGILKLG
jgi:anti-anti-sigma factor